MPPQGVSNSEERPLAGKRAAVLLYSEYATDPRPRRAAEALSNAGMEVDVVCLRESDEDKATEIINGVNVSRLRWTHQRGGKLTYFIQYGRFLVSSFEFLARRGWRKRYDLVHVHNMPDALVFAALVPKLRRSAIILDLHDPMPELMISIFGLSPNHGLVRLLRVLEHLSIGFADLALTPNISFKNVFVRRSCRPEKMQIIMNSPIEHIFDPDQFGTDSGAEQDTGEYRIMHHGSILHRHGIDLLVEAVALVRPKLPAVRLDLYGARTPFLDTILAVARRLGVDDIVRFHGPKSQIEIAKAIWNCHLGVVPNRRSAFTELNFPTRLFEYLSMHRPIVAPSLQGIRDYFSPEQLLMFEPDNVDDLAAKILWANTHPEDVQALVERGRQVYRQNLWQGEKARFLKHVADLVNTAKHSFLLSPLGLASLFPPMLS